MLTRVEEILHLREQVRILQVRVGSRDKRIVKLEKEKENKIKKETAKTLLKIKEYKERACDAEAKLKPATDSLNKLTAELSKLKRKEKRNANTK